MPSLSRRHQAWLDVATKLAVDSQCRQRHGAVIVQRNSVLGMGTNRFRNHPQFIHDYDHCSRHAEVVALRAVISRSSYVDLRRAVVYVARVGPGDRPKLSRPCNSCWNALRDAGVRTTVFTTEQGGLLETWG